MTGSKVQERRQRLPGEPGPGLEKCSLGAATTTAAATRFRDAAYRPPAPAVRLSGEPPLHPEHRSLGAATVTVAETSYRDAKNQRPGPLRQATTGKLDHGAR